MFVGKLCEYKVVERSVMVLQGFLSERGDWTLIEFEHNNNDFSLPLFSSYHAYFPVHFKLPSATQMDLSSHTLLTSSRASRTLSLYSVPSRSLKVRYMAGKPLK